MRLVLSTARYAAAVAALCWFAGGGPIASAAVQIAPALAGDSLDVLLVANAVPGGSSDGLTSLEGFEHGTLTLSFDPHVFEFPPGSGLQLSSLLPQPSLAQPSSGQPSNAPAFMALAIIYATPLADSTPPGVIASGALGVKPGAPAGPTKLTFRFDFNGGDIDFDENSNPLAHTFLVSQDVVVGIPEPSVWILSLAGLAGIGLIARRRLQR